MLIIGISDVKVWCALDYILYKSYLLDTIYGKEIEKFCVNLKKMVEIVEKLLYNEDKLNE